MGIFSCPRCVVCRLRQVSDGLPVGVRLVCVWRGSGFVKTFTSWQVLASLENTGGGTGGYSLLRITAGDLMATFDNSYKKCYNKRSDNNKNVICHQTGKNASTSRFPS